MLYKLTDKGASLVPVDMKSSEVSTKTMIMLVIMIHTVLGIRIPSH